MGNFCDRAVIVDPRTARPVQSGPPVGLIPAAAGEVRVSDDKRRKLRLLPEVLPDPTLGKGRSGGPRDRTLSHMQALFATAATAGVVAGCGDKAEPAKPEPSSTSATTATATATATASALTQKDPVPPETATPDASASAKPGTDPMNVRDAGDDAGTKKIVKPPPPPPTHYQVVDPVPTPFVQRNNNGSGVP